ncbi:MAG: InlB B-repeat-containing protein, partial [Candidatus Methanomethylophilaceae archaeon]
MVHAGKRMKMLTVAVAAIMAMVAAVIAVQPGEEVSAVGTASSPASSLYMDVVQFGIDTTGLTFLEEGDSTVTTHYLYVGSSVTIYSWSPGDAYGYCVYAVSSGFGLTCSNGEVSGTITKAGTITFTSGSFDSEISSMSNQMSKIIAVAEEDPDIPVSSISLSMSTTSSGFKITATTSPSNATYSAVAFSVTSSISTSPVYSTSGKTLNVTVSDNQIYTITCGAKDGNGASKTMKVYVSELAFNANGGSGAPSTQFVYSTSNTTHAHTIPSTTPTHSVNTFAGWATSSTGSAIYDPGDTVSLSANGWKTLYAAWITPTEISITPGSAGETMTLTATVNSYYSDKSVTWSTKQYTGSVKILSTTSDTVTVGDANGGYCTVTATANDGTGTTATITLYGTSILFLSYADTTNPAALKWVSATSESHTFTLPDTSGMEKSGYIFSGWATQSGSDVAKYNEGDKVTVNGGNYIYLYGVWAPEPVICTIIFDANGGSGEVATQKAQAGNSITLPTRGYTKSGAILAYWSKSQTGAAGVYEIGETYEVSEDVTLFAIYIDLTSASDTRAPTSVVAGETYRYEPFSGNPSEDSIYSPYSVFWTITNGSFSFVIDDCPSWMEIEWDLGITVTGTPVAEDKGIHHVSFHIEQTGVTNGELLEKVAASARDWYVAVTVPDPEYFTVTFSANGGEGEQQSFESVLDGNAITLPGGSDLGFSKTGYTQIGWSTLDSSNNKIIYALGSGFTVTSNTVFRAEWQADANLVIYDANGGVSSAKQYDIANTDGTVSLPSNGLVKSGARFGGWYVGSVSDGIYAPGMEISVSGQLHVMAYWIPTGSTVCTVTFNANGGNGSLKVDLVKGHSCILPDLGFTSDGELIGWSITSTGDDVLSPLTLFSPESTQTLYAIYSVTEEEVVRFTVV